MNVRIFWVRAMKYMYAQTRPRFILSSEGVFGGMEFEPMLTPREKSPLPKMSPEEDRTRNTVDSDPKHYQLSYSGPQAKFEYLTGKRVFLYVQECMSSYIYARILAPTRTKIAGIIEFTLKHKRKWAGYVARIKHNSFGLRV